MIRQGCSSIPSHLEVQDTFTVDIIKLTKPNISLFIHDQCSISTIYYMAKIGMSSNLAGNRPLAQCYQADVSSHWYYYNIFDMFANARGAC